MHVDDDRTVVKNSYWASKYELVKKHAHEHHRNPNWYKHEKHVLIFTYTGRPIFTKFGDEQKLSAFIGVISATLANFERLDDDLDYVMAGNYCIVFLRCGPIYLVSISNTGEGVSVIKKQLNLAHQQILSVLGGSINDLLTSHPNYDVRSSMGGTELLLNDILNDSETSPSQLFMDLQAVRLNYKVRAKVNTVLRKHRPKSVLYAMVIGDGRLISFNKHRDHACHISDILLLLNFLTNSQSLRTGESWSPMCFPAFNPDAFLYIYTNFVSPSVCICFVTNNPMEFPICSQAKETIVSILSVNETDVGLDTLSELEVACKLQQWPVEDIDSGCYNLRHAVYRSLSNHQYVMSAPGAPYNVKESTFVNTSVVGDGNGVIIPINNEIMSIDSFDFQDGLMVDEEGYKLARHSTFDLNNNAPNSIKTQQAFNDENDPVFESDEFNNDVSDGLIMDNDGVGNGGDGDIQDKISSQHESTSPLEINPTHSNTSNNSGNLKFIDVVTKLPSQASIASRSDSFGTTLSESEDFDSHVPPPPLAPYPTDLLDSNDDLLQNDSESEKIEKIENSKKNQDYEENKSIHHSDGEIRNTNANTDILKPIPVPTLPSELLPYLDYTVEFTTPSDGLRNAIVSSDQHQHQHQHQLYSPHSYFSPSSPHSHQAQSSVDFKPISHICSSMPANGPKDSPLIASVIRRYQHVYSLTHKSTNSNSSNQKTKTSSLFTSLADADLTYNYYINLQEDAMILFMAKPGDYELYLTFLPLTSKDVAVQAATRVLKWFKKNESNLFL